MPQFVTDAGNTGVNKTTVSSEDACDSEKGLITSQFDMYHVPWRIVPGKEKAWPKRGMWLRGDVRAVGRREGRTQKG